MKKFLRHILIGIVIILLGTLSALVIADTLSQEKQLLVDGDMEIAGVASWTADNDAALSKPTGAVEDGSQILRITHGGTSSPAAYQEVGTVGATYRVTGWARGDGTGIPIFKGYSTHWTGTSSTSWQYFDVTYTQDSNERVVLGTVLSVAGYAEFDDVLVTEYTPPTVNNYDQLLADGDMEIANTTSWTVGPAGTLSKQTGQGAEDGYRVLRIAYSDTANPGAYQGVLTSGQTYRITGWARGDGSVAPVVYPGGTAWTGTSSTSWQYFDVTATAASTTLTLRMLASSGYVEFDDVLVTEYTPPTVNNYDQLLADGDMDEDGTDIPFIKKFDLTQAANITADSGSITGALTYACAGAEFDGTNDYVTYTVPSTLFSTSPKISIVVEFTPDFAADSGTGHYLYDSIADHRYLVHKVDDDTLSIYLGDTSIADVAYATYGAYWLQNARNVLVISGTTGDTDAWLNGTQILTNDATAWVPGAPTSLYVGALNDGTLKFDGEIHAVSIYSGLLDGTDATNLYNSVDTDDWTVGSSACLTKQLGGSEDGSQVLRVAYDGSSTPYAMQSILTIDKKYRVTGWARGDGTYLPRVVHSAQIWAGTTSTSWQYFDETFTAGESSFTLKSDASAAGHVEFDDIMVTEIL